MEKIHIYNNFLSNDELEQCKLVIAKSNWEYGHHSQTEPLSIPFWFMDLINNDFFTIHLKHKIELLMNKKFKLNRVYVNGQTFGQDGLFHQDDTNDNSTTFCIYITPLPDDIFEQVGGHIWFKIPNMNNFSVCVEPLYNRAISFPSNYFHKGTAFNRFINNIRICIAWKLEEII